MNIASKLVYRVKARYKPRTPTYRPELIDNGVELSVRHLKQFFKFGHGRSAFKTKAVHDVSFDINPLQCVHDLNDSGDHHCDAENKKHHPLPLCHCHLPYLPSSSLSLTRNFWFLTFFSSLAAFTMSDEGSPEKFPFFRISAKKIFKRCDGFHQCQ